MVTANLNSSSSRRMATEMMLNKTTFIFLCRLLEFMINESNHIELRIESAVVLGSLAKGTEDNIRGLIEAGAVSVLLKGKYIYIE